jgi:hypothetical protein
MDTMAKAARVIGCTRSHLSQLANKWADLLDLPRPGTLKRDEARESYRENRENDHWRNRKC